MGHLDGWWMDEEINLCVLQWIRYEWMRERMNNPVTVYTSKYVVDDAWWISAKT